MADDAIIAIDHRQRIILFNQGAAHVFGYRLGEVIGKPLDCLLPERYRPLHKQHVRAFEASAESSRRMADRTMVFGLRRDGTEFPAQASILKLDTGDGIIFVVILRDITAMKDTEQALATARDEALAASKFKSAFLANMSHEIRTPMNGIVGMTEMLRDTPLTPMQQELADIVRDSADTLLAIINDILDFSRIEAGKLVLDPVVFEFRAIVEGVAVLLSAKARNKDLALLCYVDPRIPDLLYGDSVRLRQVLINLVDNAVKFTDRGEVAIEAALAESDEEQVRLRLSVRDTGIGISQEGLGRLFEPFTQADSSTTRAYAGSGLGLSICKRLVELMGGQIDVESVPGQGATFSFSVPLRRGDPSEAPPAVDVSRLGSLKVLVVDDSATSRFILKNYLSWWGMHCTLAKGATEALGHLRAATRDARPYDIAIADLRMPQIDGATLVRTAHEEAISPRTKWVALTAFDQAGQGGKMLAGGFSAYITKPVRQSQLFDCLMEVTGGQVGMYASGLGGHPGPNPFSDTPPRILVAEDNAVNQKVMVLQLERIGITPDVVSSGIEALEAMRREGYDLIFMDCQMPVLDGYEATRSIRRLETGTGKRVPVIALTASALPGDREKCLAAGMDDYLSKPVTPGRLEAVLHRWLEDAKAGEAGKGAQALSPHAMVDYRLLREVFRDEPTIRRLLKLFLDSSPALIDRLARACDGRDPAGLGAAAHELAGAANMVAASQIGDLAAAIERQAQQQNWNELERRCQTLENLLGQMAVEVSENLPPLPDA